jgi:RNA polymerase sigma factor (sigma-70 family)
MLDERMMTVATDEEELRRYQDGDIGALGRLWTRHRPRLRHWAAGRIPRSLRAHVSPEDLVQDAFLRSMAALRTLELRRPHDLFGYLRTVVLNQIRDHERRNAVRPQREDAVLEGYCDERPSPLDDLLGREALARCREAMARLTETDRRIVTALADRRRSDREMAVLLGKPSAAAARMARSRARIRLAELMASS